MTVLEALRYANCGLKLYSVAYGNVIFKRIENEHIYVGFNFSDKILEYDENGKLSQDGNIDLYPSSKCKDWKIFGWKRGDVLFNEELNQYIIFNDWYTEDYISFEGMYFKDSENNVNVHPLSLFSSDKYMKIEDCDEYYKLLESLLQGRISRETLKFYPNQEFKDGDIICFDEEGSYADCTCIYKSNEDNKLYFHVLVNFSNVCPNSFYNGSMYDKRPARFATEEEKYKLFSILKRDSKVWDSERKEIIYELQPFQKVLVRNFYNETWRINYYSHRQGKKFPYACLSGNFKYCIPFNEETKRLLGTKNSL